MNGSTDLERVHEWQHNHVEFGVSQAARCPRFQMNDRMLRREMRWPLMFMVFVHCLCVWKGMKDRCG